ncbi:hypothetical protein [Marinicellulosiphila megalodicopiae]|uniref:hypothetical protein n=1 Tax=Marinicellulosiphila megalodicopiae TaxID=2724896 RepID=UPI003BB1CE26
MAIVPIRKKSTQNYSIFRRGQVARAMFDRINDQYAYLPNGLTSDYLVDQIEKSLEHCPASHLVGNSWDDIVQKCMDYLMKRPHDFEADNLKMRLFIRLLQHEQYA